MAGAPVSVTGVGTLLPGIDWLRPVWSVNVTPVGVQPFAAVIGPLPVTLDNVTA